MGSVGVVGIMVATVAPTHGADIVVPTTLGISDVGIRKRSSLGVESVVTPSNLPCSIGLSLMASTVVPNIHILLDTYHLNDFCSREFRAIPKK